MTPKLISGLRRFSYAAIMLAGIWPLIGMILLAGLPSPLSYAVFMTLYWPLLITGFVILCVAKIAAWTSHQPVESKSNPTATVLRRTGLVLIGAGPIAMQIAAAGFVAQGPLPPVIEWLAYFCFFGWPWLGLFGVGLIIVSIIRQRKSQAELT